MDTRKKVGKEAVRTALQALGEGGKEISYRLVYEALGLESEAEQAVVRSRISGTGKSNGRAPAVSSTISNTVPARGRAMEPCGVLSARPSRGGRYRTAL